jgi:multiple sugar transport system permease protein
MLPSTLTISFFIAWQLNKKIAGIKVFRVLYYLPCVMPGIVSSIVYKYIFSPEPYGLLNTLYTSILGLDPTKVEPFKFLEAESQSTALISFMCTSIFGLAGSMPFWIAGFRSVSPSLTEAADLDGANGTQKMFLIIIPMMSKFIFYQLLMGVIGTFQIGQGVITLSPRGGYNGNLNFYGLLIYNTGYVGFNMGYGSALAYMLFIIIAILSIFTFRFNKFVYYEAED